jgi:kelch-like protein 18
VKILKNVAKDAKFVELRLNAVCEILSSDVLNVQHEIEVFFAAKVWIEHNVRRERYLSRVMDCVRFAFMKIHELIYISRHDNRLQKNEYCRELLKNACWYDFLFNL